MKTTFTFIIMATLTCFTAGWAQPFHTWSIHNAGGTSQTVAGSVTDATGNIYNFGHFAGTVDFDPGTGTTNLTAIGLSDLFIQKLSPSGTLLWVHRVGSSGNQTASRIDLDPVTNDILMIGSLPGVTAVDFDPSAAVNSLSSSSKVFLWRLTSNGAFVSVKGWTSTGAVSLTALEIANNGDVYIGGNYASFGTTAMDLDPNAGIVTFGATLGQGTDGFLLKLNSAGNFVWAKQYRSNNNTSSSTINGICLNTAQNVVFVGGRYVGVVLFSPTEQPSFLTTSAGQGDMFMQTFNSSTGAAATVESRGNTEDDAITTLKTNGSSVYIGGYFRGTVNFDPGFTNTSLSTLGQADIFLLRMNNFNPQPGVNFGWVRRTGGTANDFMADLSLDAANNIYCGSHFNGSIDADPGAGTFTLTSAGQQDIAIQKIDQSGNYIWALRVGGFTNDGLSSIHSNTSNVWYSGYFSGTVDLNPLAGTQNFSTSGGTDLDVFSTRLNQCGDVPVISSNTPVCQGSAINLSAPTIAGAAYNWSGPSSFSSTLEDPVRTNASTLHSGEYTLSVSVGTCVFPSATTIVNVQSVNASITASGPTTFCSGGSVTLTSASATGNMWSTGQTTQSIVVTSSGTYTVTVNDGTCSATSAGTTVTVNPTPAMPTITVSGSTTFCSGGSVTLTASPGSSYLWSNGATTPSINVTTAGTYTVQVTNASGCQSAASSGTTVTVNSLPASPTITAGGPTTFCSGGSVTLTASPGSSYLWSNGATTPSINITTAGTYTVQVTNAAGCQSAASSGTTVTVNSLPATPTITAGGPTSFCAGGSVTLTSSAGSSYLWSNGATTPSINVTTAGTYTVQVTNASGCQSAASTGTTVTVNSLPASPTISASGSTTFCAGGSVTLTSSAGSSYLWSNGATTPSINVTSAGTYTVQVTNAAGCQSAASSGTTVTVNSLPATPTISASGPTTFCAGGSVNLVASSGSSYLWSNGATTQLINVTTPGTYTVQITNAAGCQSGSSAAQTVTVNAATNITSQPVSPGLICAGSPFTLSATAVGTNLTYQWLLAGTPIVGANAATYTVSSATTSQAGAYLLQVNGTCGSTLTNVVIVDVFSAPGITTQPQSQSVCQGQNVLFSVNATGNNVSYQWRFNGNPIAGATSSNLTISAVTPSQAGNYTVVITNSCGSVTSSSASLVVNTAPTITSQPSSAIVCQGGSVTLSASFSGTPSAYQWKRNGVVIPGATSAILTISSAQPSDEGNYTLDYTTTCGILTSQSAFIDVQITPTIVQQPVGANICVGQTLNLSVQTQGDADYYQWLLNSSPIVGATSASYNVPSVTAAQAGTYTVIAGNNICNNSSLSQDAVVLVNAAPVFSQQPVGGSYCEGETISLLAQFNNNVDGYEWLYIGSPVPGGNGPVLTLNNVQPSQTGVYVLNAFNQCGNTFSSFANVQVNSTYQQTITQTICFGDSYAFNGTNLTQSGTFVEQLQTITGCDSVTTLILSVLPENQTQLSASICLGDSYLFDGQSLTTSGTYTANYTSINGCDSLVELNLVVTDPNTIYSTSEVICPGSSYQWGNQTLTSVGTYQQTFVSQGGCDSVVVLTLGFYSIPNVTISNTSNVLSVNGSFLGYQWFLNGVAINGETNSTITVEESGDYTVEVVTVDGCTVLSNNMNVVIDNSGLTEENSADWVIYPNPASDFITITFLGNWTSQQQKVTLLDLSGRMVKEELLIPSNSKVTIDLTQLQTGSYILQVSNSIKKFIKQ